MNCYALDLATCSFIRTYAFLLSDAKISLDVLNPNFVKEMDEYADAVIGNKRVLGVLYRGTDYKTLTEQSADSPISPAPVESMVPYIQERLDTYHYEEITVATEDEEALSFLRKTFPGKVFAVSQERYTTSCASRAHSIQS